MCLKGERKSLQPDVRKMATRGTLVEENIRQLMIGMT